MHLFRPLSRVAPLASSPHPIRPSVPHVPRCLLLSNPICETQTTLEVGGWTWNWMEPPLGQMSFFLLTLQFAQNMMGNINSQPHLKMIQNRADKLHGQFPQYNKDVVADFAKANSPIAEGMAI